LTKYNTYIDTTIRVEKINLEKTLENANLPQDSAGSYNEDPRFTSAHIAASP
jgi:hypothetical protein